MLPLGLAWNLSTEALYDFFRDIQSKPDPLGVQILGCLDEPKELEKLFLVNLFDSDTCIWNFNEKNFTAFQFLEI